jgi:hypothetical protein
MQKAVSMVQVHPGRARFVLVVLVGSLSLAACIGVEAEPPPGELGGAGGEGSAVSSAGSGPSSDTSGTGGLAGTDPALGTGGVLQTGGSPSTGVSTTLDYPGSTIALCPGEVVVSLPVDSFVACNLIGCQMAHCVPRGAIPADVPIELLGVCDDPTTVCVPDDYTATFGKFLAQTCSSLLGAEGRCISTCIPEINGLMDALPQANCGANERCAPCIHPNDGTETGACSQGCDPGPSAETLNSPVLFAKCAGGEGVCTPREIIPEVLLSHLAQLDCPSADQVCSPLEKAYNLKYNFPACTPSDPFVSLLAVPNPDGQMGGCVPAWVADINPFEGLFLHQDTCAPGDKCAPCNNPVRGNIPTGACPVPLPSDPSGGLPPDSSGGGGL